ncbi:MAG: alpha/beta fold hydrolase [Hyphomicrobiales bacterium]|nr:alpha/beta fold hydrolase [Hyphomicrobiales bacterium]
MDQPATPAPLSQVAAAATVARTRWQGATTVWRVWGSGHPVILVHGAFGSWTHWLRTIPDLAADHRLLVPDLPGFGDSDDPVCEDALEAIPGALLAGMESLVDLDVGISVVGFSFGSVMAGALAARLADAHPGALRRLVLVAPAGIGMPTRRAAGLASMDPAMDTAARRAVHRRNLGIVMLADPASIGEEAVDIQAVNTARTRLSGKPYSRSATLSEVCPTLPLDRIDTISGTVDAYARRHGTAYHDRIGALHPNLSVHRVDGAGHWVQYEAPTAFNAILRACLNVDGS